MINTPEISQKGRKEQKRGVAVRCRRPGPRALFQCVGPQELALRCWQVLAFQIRSSSSLGVKALTYKLKKLLYGLPVCPIVILFVYFARLSV